MTGGRNTDVRPGAPGEAAALTDLALRAKAHWGYDEAFMERARPELVVADDDLPRTLVAERDGAPAGFATLDPRARELVALFVAPEAMGAGVGKALLAAAREAAGGRELLIESDPNAEPFYLAQGARRVGERVSTSTGRRLPLLAL
jgi:GNAT superfamily N-acetyltransferase